MTRAVMIPEEEYHLLKSTGGKLLVGGVADRSSSHLEETLTQTPVSQRNRHVYEGHISMYVGIVVINWDRV